MAKNKISPYRVEMNDVDWESLNYVLDKECMNHIGRNEKFMLGWLRACLSKNVENSIPTTTQMLIQKTGMTEDEVERVLKSLEENNVVKIKTKVYKDDVVNYITLKGRYKNVTHSPKEKMNVRS